MTPQSGKPALSEHEHPMQTARAGDALALGGALRHDPRHLAAWPIVQNALRQWWKIATPLSLVLAAATAGVVFLTFKPVYRSQSWLQIEDATPYIAFPDHEMLSERTAQRFAETQVQLMRSPLILAPVLGHTEIANLPEVREQEDPVVWLAEEIRVMSLGNSELFQISLDLPSAEDARQIVDAVVTEYLARRSEHEDKRAREVINLLQQAKEQHARQVVQLRGNLRELTKQVTGKEPTSLNPLAGPDGGAHPLSAMQDRLTAVEVEREVLEAQLKAYNESLAQDTVDIAAPAVVQAVDELDAVKKAKEQLQIKKAKLNAIESHSKLREQDPSYRALKSEIALDDASLDQLRRDLREQKKSDLDAVLANRHRGVLAELQARQQSFALTEQLLRERYETQLKALSKLSSGAQEIEFARAELDRHERVLALVSERTLKLSTELGAPARVTLLQKASMPGMPVEAIPIKRLAIAVPIALLFPFALAFLWERIVRRVLSSQQLKQESRLPVIAEIAALPAWIDFSKGQAATGAGKKIGLFQESIDSLRTSLMLADPLGKMKIFAITSAINGEGKTSIASQLAVSLSRSSGQPTLLIDADMRRPDVHGIFDIRSEPGLVDVLAHRCALEDAIVTSWSDTLHVLPAGKLFTSPHKLVGNGSLPPLWEAVRARYRYVVIDTPPILPASEALVFAKAADAVLLCTMRDVSRLEQVKAGFEKLLAAGVGPIGAVLNGMPTGVYAKAYDYDYTLDT